jgi:hypothetical protein
MRARSILRGAALCCLAFCISCQSGIWKQGGDKLAKGSLVGSSAGIGALAGGPIGALVGGVLGYFGVSLVEVETAFADFREQYKEDVDAARSTGVQQGADVSQQFLAVLQGNPEAAAFLREQATAAAVGVATSKASGVFWKVVWIIAALVAAYLAKQFWWKRKNDARYLKREESSGQ